MEMKWINESNMEAGGDENLNENAEANKTIVSGKKNKSVCIKPANGRIRRSRSHRYVKPGQRRLIKNNNMISRLDKYINRNEEKIILDQNKIDKNNQISKLRLEANKIKVEIMKIQKDKYEKENNEMNLLIEEKKKQLTGKKKKAVKKINTDDPVILKLVEEEVNTPPLINLIEDKALDNHKSQSVSEKEMGILVPYKPASENNKNYDDDDYHIEYGQLESFIGFLKS